ncbi:hypothetical protein PINS_up000322 [Pythium insidiosum]|nr:hypothetical protein PINS_up000322 [Pythium insidiosum]
MAATTTAAVIGGLYALLLQHVNRYAPDPYMDEIFHVPQAQRYCAGRFDEWDPKITTFPGVYVVATALAHAVRWLSSAPADDPTIVCSTALLRGVNVLFAMGNAWLLVRLRTMIVPSDRNSLLHAWTIIAFPVSFFFSFLFYTDMGATFFVLLMYLLALPTSTHVESTSPIRFLPSAIAGSLAVLFRQTNIVWVVFVAGTVVVRIVEQKNGHAIYGMTKKDAKLQKIPTFVAQQPAWQIAIEFLKAIFSHLPELLALLWPFIAIVAGFIVFLVHNGGIVVGDKSNHEAGLHGAQILYFIFVASTGFGASVLAPSQIQRFADTMRRQAKSASGFVFLLFTVASVLLVVAFSSPVHKFMLADNRHYTFYVWRRFFLKHQLAKYIPISLYLLQGWRCWSELRRTRSPLWLVVFGLAVILVLVPSPLVEPRYYVIPFALLHLHTPPQPAWQLWTTLMGFAVVNALTLYVFLHRPYVWVDGSIARFMW